MTHRRITLGAVAIVAVVANAACSDSNSGNGAQAGELGRGTFSYVCGTTGTDAQCNDNADLAIVDPSTNLPPIAVSASFNVKYSNGDTQAGDADFINLDAMKTSYVALRPGYAALFGMNGVSTTTIQDVAHILFETIDHLEFAHTNPTGGNFKGEVTVPGLDLTVSVAGGAVTQLFRVVPMTKDRRLLAGALPCSWTSSDTTIAQVMSDATKNIVTVQLNKAGMATLHVTLGTMAADVTLTVGS